MLQIGCLSNHLNSKTKSALIKMFSAQIPKALNQHGIAKRKKYISEGKWMRKYSQLHRILVLEISTFSSWPSLLLITECLHAIFWSLKKVTCCYMLLRKLKRNSEVSWCLSLFLLEYGGVFSKKSSLVGD